MSGNVSSRGNRTRAKVEAYTAEKAAFALDKARDRGRRAWNEQASEQNPYPSGSAEHKAWAQAWREARDKAAQG